MTDAQLDAIIDAMLPALGLHAQPAWRDAIRMNLAVTYRLGAAVMAFPLLDEAEPAPVFQA